jgi:hypothetical protein
MSTLRELRGIGKPVCKQSIYKGSVQLRRSGSAGGVLGFKH